MSIELTPHVAKWANCIDASLDAQSEGEARMKPLRVVLARLGAVLGKPGLLAPCSMDSIGRLLTGTAGIDGDQSRAETHRVAIANPPSPDGQQQPSDVRVWLSKPVYEIISQDEAKRTLDAAGYSELVPVRGATDFARKLSWEERGEGVVRVEFGTTSAAARMRVCRRGEHGVEATILPVGRGLNSKIVLRSNSLVPNGVVGEAAERVAEELDELFTEAPGQLQSRRQPAIRPTHKPKIEHCEFFDLPDWIAEVLATLAQEVLRLHVVVAAAHPESATTALHVDRATLSRFHDRKAHSRLRCVVRLVMHAGSVRCICGAYPPSALPKGCGAPSRVELELAVCGAPLSARAQADRSAASDPASEITTCTPCAMHPDRPRLLSRWESVHCVDGFQARLICRHANGVPVNMALGVGHYDNLDLMRGGMAIAVAACSPVDLGVTRYAELQRRAAALEQELYKRLASPQASISETQMCNRDDVAIRLLRSHVVRRMQARGKAAHGAKAPSLVHAVHDQGGSGTTRIHHPAPADSPLKRSHSALAKTHAAIFYPC
jgi:hypothetical protein